LLPSQGVHWLVVDNRSARATLNEGDITITMLLPSMRKDASTL
jgi:hypothetical protein